MTFNNPIISFPSNDRQKIEYQIIKIPTKEVDGGYGQYPAICTIESETGKLLNPTKLEFYLHEKLRNGNRMTTIEGDAKVIVRLMNYILHHETINGIHEITPEILRRFEEYLKFKSSDCCGKPDEQISLETWCKYLNILYEFLESYYKKNCEKVEFNYNPKDFRQIKSCINTKDGKVTPFNSSSPFTRPPAKKPRKCRYLPKAYIELLEEEFIMHDPELYLAIKLQKTAGIREGEVVCVSRDNIHVPAGPGDIVIDLKTHPDYVKTHMGKTPIGKIKRFREQRVYPAFNHEVKKAYKEHLLREEQKFKRFGKEIDPKGPLFTNKYGKPLTTAAYNARVKKLFMNHFVPDLEEYCIATEQYDMNKVLIDAYKEKFIGCHSLRHWFTMYLRVTEGLDDEQVRIWRGDICKGSYLDYMHRNYEILESFEKVTFRFQTEMLMAIKDGKARRYLEGE